MFQRQSAETGGRAPHRLADRYGGLGKVSPQDKIFYRGLQRQVPRRHRTDARRVQTYRRGGETAAAGAQKGRVSGGERFSIVQGARLPLLCGENIYARETAMIFIAAARFRAGRCFAHR